MTQEQIEKYKKASSALNDTNRKLDYLGKMKSSLCEGYCLSLVCDSYRVHPDREDVDYILDYLIERTEVKIASIRKEIEEI